ncbi:MAG: YmdB family metallophosphoesterase [Spirochaetaceae bacterium]|jgi:metallophosphoesterase (TIGR00282 family)|nr:YmdB family metallophosphoesterase [Spirochaetaceae bacterium]
MMRILYVAEVVGKAGLYAFKKGLAGLKQKQSFDFVIACADGVTSGNGVSRGHASYIRKLGANALTTGDCCFYKKDLAENISKIPYILRPANLNPEAPGFGSRIFKAGGRKIGVAVLLGQSGFHRLHGDSPFSALPVLLEQLRQETPYIVVDFHAEATAEKRTFFAIADGRCSAAIGSHTRVQTADETILPGGAAVITDAGRTGASESVGGVDVQSRIREYLTGIPDWTKDAWDAPELQGVIVSIDDAGKACSIERVRYRVPDIAQSADAPA